MRLSSIGLIGGALLIGAVSAAPSFAGTPASVSGSATFITPAGFTSTVSAENVLSSGLYFPTIGADLKAATSTTKADLITAAITPASTPANPTTTAIAKGTSVGGSVIVLPQFTLQGFSIASESLSVASGAASSAASPISSFNLAAAAVLTNSAAATAGDQGNQIGGISDGTALLPQNEGRAVANAYYSANIDFISAIIKAGAGVNGLD